MCYYTGIHHNCWLCDSELPGADKNTTGPGHVINGLGLNGSGVCIIHIWQHQNVRTDLCWMYNNHLVSQ